SRADVTSVPAGAAIQTIDAEVRLTPVVQVSVAVGPSGFAIELADPLPAAGNDVGPPPQPPTRVVTDAAVVDIVQEIETTIITAKRLVRGAAALERPIAVFVHALLVRGTDVSTSTAVVIESQVDFASIEVDVAIAVCEVFDTCNFTFAVAAAIVHIR